MPTSPSHSEKHLVNIALLVLHCTTTPLTLMHEAANQLPISVVYLYIYPTIAEKVTNNVQLAYMESEMSALNSTTFSHYVIAKQYMRIEFYLVVSKIAVFSYMIITESSDFATTLKNTEQILSYQCVSRTRS